MGLDREEVLPALYGKECENATGAMAKISKVLQLGQQDA